MEVYKVRYMNGGKDAVMYFTGCKDRAESVPTVVEFGEGRERRKGSETLSYAVSSIAQSPVSVNLASALWRMGICLKPLILRKPRSASRKPAAA